MKRVLSAALPLAFSVLFAAAVCGCKSIVTFESLPENARTFLTGNFPECPISYAIKECNEYEVVLANGAEIEFNGKGEWKSIDMNLGIVPDGVLATLPQPALSFLSSSFPNAPVEKIEKGRCPAYKVELLSGLELEFNSKGICRRFDD